MAGGKILPLNRRQLIKKEIWIKKNTHTQFKPRPNKQKSDEVKKSLTSKRKAPISPQVPNVITNI